MEENKFQRSLLNRFLDAHDFFPGSRSRNYRELLAAFGLPHDVVEAHELAFTLAKRKDLIPCSAVILACPPALIPGDAMTELRRLSMEEGVSLIADSFLLSRRGAVDLFGNASVGGWRFAGGRMRTDNGGTLYEIEPGPYSARGPDTGLKPCLRFLLQGFHARSLRPGDAVPTAHHANGLPAILEHRFGKARNLLLNFHPAFVLREPNPFHVFLRNFLEEKGACPGVALHLLDAACLRIDDPGSCERAHLDGYNDRVLPRSAWESLLAMLRREHAHLNVAYVPQWIDDGEEERGTLEVGGKRIEQRIPGAAYDSWKIAYRKKGSAAVHDYAQEYEAIARGAKGNAVTILSHGLTHLAPDVGAWLSAPDRHRNGKWFREFRTMVRGRKATPRELLDRIRLGMDRIQEAFGTRPTVIVPSAHEHDADFGVLAREAGCLGVASRAFYPVARGSDASLRKIAAFYPPDARAGHAFLEAGYCPTLVFHDYDIRDDDHAWLVTMIGEMRRRGARRFISIEELAGLLACELDVYAENDTIELSITLPKSHPSLPPGLPFISLRCGGAIETCSIQGSIESCSIESATDLTVLRVPAKAFRDGAVRLRALRGGVHG